MVELSPQGSDTYSRAFAGDTLNTAIYLQRSLSERPAEVSYVTALGEDPLSARMQAFFASEHLDTSLVAKVADKQPGLYSIELDQHGERSFSYWRNDSAARKLLDDGLTTQQQEQLISGFDLIYLSGISLAILDDNSRQKLFDILSKARQQGCQIAFDSNYRPRLWESPEKAIEVMTRFLSLVDIALMTFDDEQMLHEDSSPEETLARLQQLGIREIIVKDGAKGCFISESDNTEFVPATKVDAVVDTTSAGDSFNAGYLASRISGLDIERSALNAHRLAGQVIQHKGAIIPATFCPGV